jgi:hypothetical protein
VCLIVDCNAEVIRLLFFSDSIIVGHYQRTFKIAHVPCSVTSHHIYTDSYTIIRHNEIQNLSLIKDSNMQEVYHMFVYHWGHAVAQLVEALHYKSEGSGFDSRWCHWNFSLA